jgi:hypothetical protein
MQHGANATDRCLDLSLFEFPRTRVVQKLAEVVTKTIVLAYRESTDRLTTALRAEGFEPEVQRANYSEEQLRYHSNFRCFMNHRDAWNVASSHNGWTMIMESDFVPCVGCGDFRFPVPNPENLGRKWAFLYTSSPRVFWEEDDRYYRGHHVCPVCYVVTPKVAELLLLCYDVITTKFGVGNYYPFDAYLNWTAIGRGAEAYLPLQSFGEHGGIPNPEHRREGVVARNGLHRADVLAAPLHFLPEYAGGSKLVFYRQRFQSRLRSVVRLVTGRWIQHVDVSDPGQVRRLLLYRSGVMRHVYSQVR